MIFEQLSGGREDGVLRHKPSLGQDLRDLSGAAPRVSYSLLSECTISLLSGAPPAGAKSLSGFAGRQGMQPADLALSRARAHVVTFSGSATISRSPSASRVGRHGFVLRVVGCAGKAWTQGVISALKTVLSSVFLLLNET
eukprot:3212308-Prymnesium_polylepis.1